MDRLKAGRRLLDSRRAEEALQHFYALHELHPEDRVVLEYLVWTGLECGRPDVVSDVLETLRSPLYEDFAGEVERLAGKALNPNLSFGAAYLRFRQGRFREAVAGFQGLTGDPRWGAWAWNLLGLCHTRAVPFQPDAAIQCFHEALAKVGGDQDYLEVYFNLAAAQYLDYRFRPALKTLEKLLELAPDYAQVQEWMGEIRERIRHGSGPGDPEGGPGVTAALPIPPTPPLHAVGVRLPPRKTA